MDFYRDEHGKSMYTISKGCGMRTGPAYQYSVGVSELFRVLDFSDTTPVCNPLE